jgi:hypothetical protein
VDLLAKVVAVSGRSFPDWCEACALPRMLRLAMHRDYSIRVVSKGSEGPGVRLMLWCMQLDGSSLERHRGGWGRGLVSRPARSCACDDAGLVAATCLLHPSWCC